MAERMGTDRQARIDTGALEQRVYSLEKLFNDIQASIAALSAKLDERSRIPVITLIAAGTFILALMTAIGVLALGPLESGQLRHQKILDAMEARYVQDLKDEIRQLQTK